MGRHHKGDENGNTYYCSAQAVLSTESLPDAPQESTIIPNSRVMSEKYKENNHVFLCPAGTVMTGRLHTGDENGATYYQYSTLKAVGKAGNILNAIITIENVHWENYFSESSGEGYNAPADRVIVGREHIGDENGQTRYATAVVKYNGHTTIIKDYTVSEARKESSGYLFQSGISQVMTGRHHYGDENGNTYCAMASD